MGKKVMILGAGPLQVPAIRKAKELGYQVIAVDYDRQAVGFGYADVRLVISTLDQEEVYRQALIYQPDIVMTSTSDGPVRTAAYVNEKLGKRPDLSYEDSLCATIKNRMRDRLKEGGVPIPAYFAVEDQQAFLRAAAFFKGRCIVKPADNAGSRGVVLLEGRKTEEELIWTYAYSREHSRNGMVMVEEVMEGHEVSVEAMTAEGETTVIAITDKFITPPPYFVEIGHSQPSCLAAESLCLVEQAALAAVKAIGLQNGPSHTEVMVTKDGPKIVELAARLGGDYITSRLVPLSVGVDMVGNSVLLAAGEKIDLTAKRPRGAAIRFLQGVPGMIGAISVDREVYARDGMEELVLYKKEGDPVNSVRSSSDRLGHIITSGETAAEAIKRAEEALRYVRIEIG
jgi:biotin carboxylase